MRTLTTKLEYKSQDMSKELIDKILQASAIINNNTRSGSGNYITVSKAVADVFNGFRKRHRKEKIIRIFNEKVQS